MMNKRNLDEIYFSVCRDGKLESICFSDLTHEEMENVTEGKDVDWLKSLCIQLGRKIRDIGDELDVMCYFGVYYSGNDFK